MTPQVRYPEVSSCQGKKRMGKRRAEVSARNLRAKGENVHEYPCRYCGWYHVGHNSRVK